jgi:hypothetical protein
MKVNKMNIKGYNSTKINGSTFFFKSEGIILLEKIEQILTNTMIFPKKKHLVILDLLKTTERHVLREGYALYYDHLNSPNPSITDRERTATEKAMHLILLALDGSYV